jgi:hypothetical protein
MAIHRATREQVRALCLRVLKETTNLKDSKEAWEGFIVGFRCYERMAQVHIRELEPTEIDEFLNMAKT